MVNLLRTNSVYTILVTVKEREGSKETIHLKFILNHSVVVLGDYFYSAKNTTETEVAFFFFKKGLSISLNV